MATEQERALKKLNTTELIQKAREIIAMPDEPYPGFGFSERDDWLRALDYNLKIRRFYLGEEYDHTRPKSDPEHDAEWAAIVDTEWNQLDSVQALLDNNNR